MLCSAEPGDVTCKPQSLWRPVVPEDKADTSKDAAGIWGWRGDGVHVSGMNLE
jgi:hypothetical protein